FSPPATCCALSTGSQSRGRGRRGGYTRTTRVISSCSDSARSRMTRWSSRDRNRPSRRSSPSPPDRQPPPLLLPQHQVGEVEKRIGPRVSTRGRDRQAAEIVLPAQRVKVDEVGGDPMREANDRRLTVGYKPDLHCARPGGQGVRLVGKVPEAPAEDDPSGRLDGERFADEGLIGARLETEH